jgi:hypothetical protein
MSVAGVGARIGAGQTYVPEWTRPGPTCRWSELRVDREPARDGALWGSPQPEPLTSGRGRLSPRTLWGAARRQGPGSSPRGSTRLDLDGWLVRFDTDTCPSERPAAHHRPTDKILALGPPPRWRSSPRPGKTHPLDTSLLMGGTIIWNFHNHFYSAQVEVPGLSARVVFFRYLPDAFGRPIRGRFRKKPIRRYPPSPLRGINLLGSRYLVWHARSWAGSGAVNQDDNLTNR